MCLGRDCGRSLILAISHATFVTSRARKDQAIHSVPHVSRDRYTMHAPDIAFGGRSGTFAAHAPGTGSSDGEGAKDNQLRYGGLFNVALCACGNTVESGSPFHDVCRLKYISKGRREMISNYCIQRQTN